MSSLVLSAPVAADYPSPRTAGFHHCALIYHRSERTAADFLPYVAEVRDGKPAAWLFDSFLFLLNRLPSGRRPTTGKTVLADWRYHLDTWFAPGRDLAALDEALDAAANTLGTPEKKRQVMFSIPRPHPAVTSFGDVDGDGRPEDLTNAAGREAVLRWYVNEACRRFAAARYKHLELWGFYWMHEAIPPDDEPLARQAAAVVHAAGKRLLWIPWYRAPGWDRWRENGIDVALMQPNYAFFSKHRGHVRRNRLTVAAYLARTAGLGIECELPMFCTDPQTRCYFLRYLADGAPGRDGYQAGATAYYLGVDNLERLCFSPESWQRELYSALAAYVHGTPIAAPDPSPVWRAQGREARSLSDGTLTDGMTLTTAETESEAPTPVAAVDVFLDEPDTDRAWQGMVTVSTRSGNSGAWTPAGWALRSHHDEANLRWQVVTVPVHGTAAGVRVALETAAGSPPPSVAEIGLDPCPGSRDMVRHLAFGLPYTLAPAPVAKYPDVGNELTDGVVATAGFSSGRTVGWHGRRVAVLFDLGRVVAVDKAEVYTEGGGYAAVNWPAEAVLFTAPDRPPPLSTAGVGRLPHGFSWTPGSLVIDRRRAPDRADGHVVFAPRRPLNARFVAFLFRTRGWLMLSEIRLLSGGKNVVRGARYTLRPRPTPDNAAAYADDGFRLTDGFVAHRFHRDALTGWTDDRPRVVTLDFPITRLVRRVIVWSFAGGRWGIFAPRSVVVETSADGNHWRRVGAAHPPLHLAETDDPQPLPLTIELPTPTPTRRLRVTVQHRRGWTMLSEIVAQ